MRVPLLGRRTLSVTREAAGSYDTSGPSAGQWRPGSTSSVLVSGSLQPVTDRDALLLPEGVRQRARHKLYTDPTTNLVTFDIDNQTRGDVVEVDGERLEVWGVRGYDGALLNHRRYMLLREPDAQ